MRYVLLMAEVPDSPAAPDPETGAEWLAAWLAEMDRRGIVHEGNRLRPPAEARTVSKRDGETLSVHGPYAEVQEQVAGYEVIEAADLDEAIEIAALHPSARLGAVEIRPAWVE